MPDVTEKKKDVDPDAEVVETADANPDDIEKSQTEAVEKEVEDGKQKLDLRKMAFQEKERNEKLMAEKKALEEKVDKYEAALNNNTDAMKALAGKEQSKTDEPESADDDWLAGLGDILGENQEEKKEPSVIDPKQLTSLVAEKVKEQLKQFEERSERRAEVARGMDAVGKFLDANFESPEELAKARHLIETKAMETGYAPLNVYLAEFPDKAIEIIAKAEHAKAKQEAEKEFKAKLAEVGGEGMMVSMGYTQPEADPLAELDKAEAKELEEMPDGL